MTSTPGQSLYPDIQTTKANTIPSALNKLQTTSSFALDALKSARGLAPIGNAAGSSVISYGGNVAGNTVGNIAGDLASQFGTGTTRYASTFAGNTGALGEAVGDQLIEQGTKQAATKTGLGTLGTVMAGIGTAYGLTDLGMQLAANKDHRNAGQMRDTLTTNTYTTDLGNQYTTHGGVNVGNELNYAKAQRRSRNLNFTASAIGTGASAGALIGSLAATGAAAGSVAPGIGTAIGAGVGLLGGGIAYLAGLGNTEEATREAANTLTDSVTMENKMSESIAKSLDAKQGFYGRTKSGSLSAANGKRPIHARNGYGNAMVSHGEVIGNLNEGWAYREPGVPDNNDTLKRHIAKDDFVISNKYGLSDYAASTGDLVGALQLQDMLMKYNRGKGYKCGKLPKYYDGTPMQTIAASVPHFGAILSNWMQANALKNSDRRTQIEPISDLGASNVAAEMMGDQIDARPLLRIADQDLASMLYRNSREVGLGHGGRMVRGVDLFDKGLRYKSDILNKIQQQNLAQRNAARELKFKNYLDMRNLKHSSWWKTEAEKLQKEGAYNNLMAQIPLNLYNIGSSWASNLSNIWQNNTAMNIEQQKANDLGYKYSTDAQNQRDQIANMAKWINFANGGGSTPATVTSPAPVVATQTPATNSQYSNLMNNANFMRWLLNGG